MAAHPVVQTAHALSLHLPVPAALSNAFTRQAFGGSPTGWLRVTTFALIEAPPISNPPPIARLPGGQVTVTVLELAAVFLLRYVAREIVAAEAEPGGP